MVECHLQGGMLYYTEILEYGMISRLLDVYTVFIATMLYRRYSRYITVRMIDIFYVIRPEALKVNYCSTECELCIYCCFMS